MLTLGDTVCALVMPLADLCPLCMWQQEATSFAEHLLYFLKQPSCEHHTGARPGVLDLV